MRLLQESDRGLKVQLWPAAASAPLESPLLWICCAPGKAYSLGRAEYGRLGLGAGAEEKSTPTVIPELPSISSVACGASVGYAVSSDGECWGPPWARDRRPVYPPHLSSVHPGALPSLGPWVRPAPLSCIARCRLGRAWSQVLALVRAPSLGAAGQQLLEYFCGPSAARFVTGCQPRGGCWPAGRFSAP